VSGRARLAESHEAEYDLLTAALLGVALGAGVTYLLRTGPSGRPITPALRGAKQGLRWMGTHASDLGSRGAKWAASTGEELWDRVPRDEIEKGVREQLGSLEDFVDAEVRALRKAVRRRRRALGI
jgi:hypothetical protein